MDNEIRIKQQLFDFCISFLSSKQKNLSVALQMAREAVADDSKSSAGDKHETGRAMAQLEQEKLAGQFAELQRSQLVLSKITPEKINSSISLGSVVYTHHGNYFISISAGKVEVEGISFFVVSPSSPIGSALMTSDKKDHFIFNGTKYQISKIF